MIFLFLLICNIAEENKIWKTPATDVNLLSLINQPLLIT